MRLWTRGGALTCSGVEAWRCVPSLLQQQQQLLWSHPLLPRPRPPSPSQVQVKINKFNKMLRWQARERWEDLCTALLRAPSCPGKFWRALSPDELRTLLVTLGIFMENHFFAKLVTEIAVAGRERFRRTDPYPFPVGDGMIGVREFIRYFKETNVFTGVSTFVWSAPPAWEAGSGRYFDGHSHGDFGSTAVKEAQRPTAAP